MADEETTEEITQNIEEEDENILLWETLGVSFGIDIFLTRIEREVALLRNAGITQRGIVDILRNDLTTNGRIFGEFRNTIKRGVVSSVMQASRIGQDRVYGDRMMFRWVSVGTPKICGDCAARIGEVKSWEEWEALGLPASGFSVCKEFCYCQLVPEEVEMPSSLRL